MHSHLEEERLATFACDLCGTIGRAPAPGAAQCPTCGHVAIAGREAEAAASSRRAPGATSPEAGATPREGAGDVAPRLATLWVRPGPEESPTPEPFAIPARRRTVRTAAISLALLASGAALALGAAAVLRGGGNTPSAPGPAPVAAAPFAGTPASAPSQRARTEDAAPAPVARPERPSAPPVASAAPPRRTARIAAPAAPAAASLDGASSRPNALQDPSPADRRCVPRALRARRDLAGRLPAEIAVRFQVAASGAVGRVEVLGEIEDRDVETAIEEAVHGCTFVPGSDEAGRPTALPVVMRIRFAPAGGTF